MRYQYSYYLSSSIKFIQKNKIHSYQFTIKFFKTFTKLIILLSIDQFPHLEKFPQKERFDCVPIFTQCHRTFLQNGKTAVSRKSLKRVIREPVAHLSLHPLSPTTLLSFYTTHPCLRPCIRVYAVATTFEIPNLT